MFGRKFDTSEKTEKKSRANSGEVWIKRMPKGATEFLVRPLTEPEQWISYVEVWDNNIRRSWPVPSEDVVELEEGQEFRNRHLAVLLDVKEDRVMAFQLPAAAADDFATRWRRTGTVTDRDWYILRSGSGLETEYSTDHDDPSERDLSKYDIPDLEQVIMDAYQHAVDEGWTEALDLEAIVEKIRGTDEDVVTDEVVPPPAKKAAAKKTAAKKAPAKKAAAPAEVDEPDVAVEPEVMPEEKVDAGIVALTDEELQNAPLSKLRAWARDRGINPSGLGKAELLEALTDEPF